MRVRTTRGETSRAGEREPTDRGGQRVPCITSGRSEKKFLSEDFGRPRVPWAASPFAAWSPESNLCPTARVTIIDADAAHLARARAHLAACHHPALELVHTTWDPRAPQTHDLIIVPLALVGDREAVYTAPGPPRLVHDWVWRRRGPGVVVSWPLLKRLNLVRPRP